MGWDDDDEKFPELSDDPDAVARRAEASRERTIAGQRILRWAYLVLALLIVLVIVVWRLAG